MPEADQHVLGVQRLDLQEDAVVEHVLHHGPHVVRLVVRVGQERVELLVGLVDLELDLVVEGQRVREVVLREVDEQRAHVVQRVVLVGGHVVRDARARVVRRRAAELLEADVLAGDRTDDVGAGDEHVGRAVDHHDEVGQRGGVHGAARRRAEDEADLRDDPRGGDVAAEDLRELRQAGHALLDPGTAAVADADQRHARAQREVHDLGDLLPVHLAQAAAEDREVLGVDADRAAVDRAVPDDDAVAGDALRLEAEVGGAVPHERVELGERARVQELVDALARRPPPARVLLVHGVLLGVLRRVVPVREVGQLGGRRARGRLRGLRGVSHPTRLVVDAHHARAGG